jgi:hypothetical protein
MAATATHVTATAATKVTTTTGVSAAYSSAATIAASHSACISASGCCSVAAAIPAGISATVPVPAAISVSATKAESTATPAMAPSVPRTGADEHAAVEPVGSVVPIRRATVRVVRVIAPLANRGTVSVRRLNNCGAHANPHRHLSVCSNRKRQN